MYSFLKNRRARALFGFSLFILVILIIYYLRMIFIPFFISLLAAYILNPVVNWMEKRKINRTLGVTFLFVVVFWVLFIVVGVGGAFILGQGNDLVMVVAGDEYKDMDGNGAFDEGIDKLTFDRNQDGIYTAPLFRKFSEWALSVGVKLSKRITKDEDATDVIRDTLDKWEGYYKTAIDEMKINIGEYATAFFKNTLAILAYIIGFLLVPVYTFFLLREWENIKLKIIPLLPGRSRDQILRIVSRIDRAVSAFFRGRVMVCTICSIITWIGLWVIGVPYAFLFGVLIGTATVIPFLGLAFLAPALIVGYLSNPATGISLVVWTTILYFMVQALQGAVLDPLILGREVELHPVVLILAFLVCGKVLGFVGVLLAVPIASIGKILTQEFIMPSVAELAAEQRTTMIRRREAIQEHDPDTDLDGEA